MFYLVKWRTSIANTFFFFFAELRYWILMCKTERAVIVVCFGVVRSRCVLQGLFSATLPTIERLCCSFAIHDLWHWPALFCLCSTLLKLKLRVFSVPQFYLPMSSILLKLFLCVLKWAFFGDSPTLNKLSPHHIIQKSSSILVSNHRAVLTLYTVSVVAFSHPYLW